MSERSKLVIAEDQKTATFTDKNGKVTKLIVKPRDGVCPCGFCFFGDKPECYVAPCSSWDTKDEKEYFWVKDPQQL